MRSTELFLMRHGLAEARVSTNSDHSRALTAEGIDKLRRIAAGMKQLKLHFDRVLSSPLVRARQTAEIVCESLSENGAFHTAAELSPGSGPNALAELLRNKYSNVGALLLVGHEPDLGEFASYVLTGDTSTAIHFKKGGLCKLTLPPPIFARHGVLEWHLTPGQLARIK